MSNWSKAAHRYRENSVEAKKAAKDEALVQTTKELDAFLESSEGQEAMLLLEASQRFIRLGEEEGAGGSTVVYYLDGKGFYQSSEQNGLGAAMSAANSGEVTKPNVTSMIPIEFVRRVMHCKDGKKASEIVPFIHSELDRIADAAP